MSSQLMAIEYSVTHSYPLVVTTPNPPTPVAPEAPLTTAPNPTRDDKTNTKIPGLQCYDYSHKTKYTLHAESVGPKNIYVLLN